MKEHGDEEGDGEVLAVQGVDLRFCKGKFYGVKKFF